MPFETLTPAAAALELEVSTRTLLRWARSGKLTGHFRTVGKHSRYTVESVEALKVARLEARRKRALKLSPDERAAQRAKHQAMTDEVVAGRTSFWWLSPGPPARLSKKAEAKLAAERRREQKALQRLRVEQADNDLPARFGLTRQQLYEKIWIESVTVVSKQLGLTIKALWKVCRFYCIPTPPRGHHRRRDRGKNRAPLAIVKNGSISDVSPGYRALNTEPNKSNGCRGRSAC